MNIINNVTENIKKIIKSNDIDISSIKFNENLNPEIWNNEKLDPNVRYYMLKNARNFIDFCDLKNLKYNDIIFTGSNANYNYSKYSDIDIHIILDFNQISNNDDLLSEFFKIKKDLWKINIDSKIKDYDVELYFQNKDENLTASGIYSIYYDKWVNKPIKKIINIDTNTIKNKVLDFANEINKLENNIDDNDWIIKYNKLKDKIKRYRKTGLSNNGEYSIENMVFKILRNEKYLDKLLDLKNQKLHDTLTLKEFE